mmetsp:Transcript_67042/g.212185  ORF Transcript_67042/g.212185 Transcript_67042/m.212185 type:complete len:211 (+) Transcript_67042:1039-1671(+)
MRDLVSRKLSCAIRRSAVSREVGFAFDLATAATAAVCVTVWAQGGRTGHSLRALGWAQYRRTGHVPWILNPLGHRSAPRQSEESLPPQGLRAGGGGIPQRHHPRLGNGPITSRPLARGAIATGWRRSRRAAGNESINAHLCGEYLGIDLVGCVYGHVAGGGGGARVGARRARGRDAATACSILHPRAPRGTLLLLLRGGIALGRSVLLFR